jgi:hypothetical protein
LVHKPVPGGAAAVHDGVVGVEHAVAELIVAQVIPDVLDRVQLGAVGWQVQQGDVLRHAQAATQLVPAGAVADQQGMRTGGDIAADLGQVQGHGLGVGVRQHEGRADAVLGAHRPEQVGPLVADRGRDAHHCAPPAQNRTGGIPAYGSHLGCLTANRWDGQG